VTVRVAAFKQYMSKILVLYRGSSKFSGVRMFGKVRLQRLRISSHIAVPVDAEAGLLGELRLYLLILLDIVMLTLTVVLSYLLVWS
jgi:hypothetical protein